MGPRPEDATGHAKGADVMDSTSRMEFIESTAWISTGGLGVLTAFVAFGSLHGPWGICMALWGLSLAFALGISIGARPKTARISKVFVLLGAVVFSLGLLNEEYDFLPGDGAKYATFAFLTIIGGTIAWLVQAHQKIPVAIFLLSTVFGLFVFFGRMLGVGTSDVGGTPEDPYADATGWLVWGVLSAMAGLAMALGRIPGFPRPPAMKGAT